MSCGNNTQIALGAGIRNGISGCAAQSGFVSYPVLSKGWASGFTQPLGLSTGVMRSRRSAGTCRSRLTAAFKSRSCRVWQPSQIQKR
jgi:hypothetical protein